jgi:hypothetical protein
MRIKITPDEDPIVVEVNNSVWQATAEELDTTDFGCICEALFDSRSALVHLGAAGWEETDIEPNSRIVNEY